MKKNNNNGKYRSNNNNNNNNYNNQIYSLNYKFDSCSVAGKCCGTALDLIKRYNELAKEAHSNNNYVEAEVFRQYAEHYRKIVTEINERKNQYQASLPAQSSENSSSDETSETSADAAPVEAAPVVETVAAPVVKRAFKVIEIAPEDAKADLIENKVKTPRVSRRRTSEATA